MTLLRRAGIGAAGAALVIALWAIMRSTGASRWAQARCEHMATTITVTAAADRAEEAGSIVADVFERIDLMMSEWKPGSPLTEINDAAGLRPVEAPPELFNLIALGVELGDTTGGAFDITWAALWGLWDFKAQQPALPDPAEIEGRLARVDYRRIQLDPESRTVLLPEPGMLIGLGAIAKGHALDVAARELRAAGIGDFLIVAGGQVYASGDRNGRPWRIGVRDPRAGPDDLIATIELRDGSASTSGDYERFFIIDGRRYHHVLDPRTGRPATAAQSVTLVSASATLADALSTALMVLGPQEGAALVDRYDVWAAVIDPAGNLTTLGSREPPSFAFHLDSQSLQGP